MSSTLIYPVDATKEYMAKIYRIRYYLEGLIVTKFVIWAQLQKNETS